MEVARLPDKYAYAFVSYKSAASAAVAIEALHNKKVSVRKLGQGPGASGQHGWFSPAWRSVRCLRNAVRI